MIFTRRSVTLMLAGAAFFRTQFLKAAESARTALTPAPGPAALPKDIVWVTDNDQPIIGSENAIKGGTFNYYMDEYPLTFRIMGPNNNGAFAWWNQQFTSSFALVGRHPVTDKYIPLMATHWSIQPDEKTIYFKLDPDGKFSDGHRITADDYVFTWKMMQSKFIVDPFYNSYAERYFKSVDKIDDYTLRVVGTRPSWRPLSDYAGLWPTPAHVTKLDEDWVTRTTNEPQVAVGPYVVSKTVRGESVTLKRVANWWGDKKRYFIGQYNFDEIVLRVIQEERALDYLRLGQIDLKSEGTARTWNESYTFPAVTNGWIHRVRVFTDTPSGAYGLGMNTEAPIFQSKDFRTALQYLFNFDRLNRNLMYNEYFRQRSFFEGTEFANPNLRPYEFNSERAREFLERAGYRRPASVVSRSTLAKLRNVAYGLLFTRSDDDDILVNAKGEKASFILTYGAKGLERHLTVVQQDFRRAGVEMKLQLLEPGTAFQRNLERKFEMTLNSMSANFYPEPRQYLGSEFKKAKNSNAFWGFASLEVDALIKTYEEDQDAEKRKAAMYRIDEIVHDEAFLIQFWTAPYIRLAYWDYIQWPEFYLPKRTQAISEYMVWWIDPAKKAALEEAKRTNKAYPLDKELDKDFYHLKQ